MTRSYQAKGRSNLESVSCRPVRCGVLRDGLCRTVSNRLDECSRRLYELSIALGGRSVGKHQDVFEADSGSETLSHRLFQERPRRSVLTVQENSRPIASVGRCVVSHRGHHAFGFRQCNGGGGIGEFQKDAQTAAPARPVPPRSHLFSVPQSGLHADTDLHEHLGELYDAGLVPVDGDEVRKNGPSADHGDPISWPGGGPRSGRETDRYSGRCCSYGVQELGHRHRIDGVGTVAVLGVDVQSIRTRPD
jgi:hypothetical protein